MPATLRSMTESEKMGFSGLSSAAIGETGPYLVVAGRDDDGRGRIEVFTRRGDSDRAAWTVATEVHLVKAFADVILKTLERFGRK